tara:strand:+ start:3337 stop:4851 length:1515 start_codon:yes stop_codon:yes gene_type:complete
MILFTTLLLFSYVQSYAITLTLDDCYRKAQQHHPKIIRAKQNWQLAKIENQRRIQGLSPTLSPVSIHTDLSKEARPTASSSLSWRLLSATELRYEPSLSWHYPVGTHAHYSDNEDILHTTGAKRDSRFQSTLSINQPIFGPHVYQDYYHHLDGKDQLVIAHMAYKESILKALYETGERFRHLVQSINQESITRHKLSQDKQRFKKYEIEVNSGKSPRSILHEYRTSILQSELNLLKIQANIRRQTHAFKRLIGIPSYQNIDIDSRIPLTMIQPPSLDKILLSSLTHHPELIQSKIHLAMQKRQLHLANASLWPSINLDAHMTTPPGLTSDPTSKIKAGIHLQIPLDNRSAYHQKNTQDTQYQIAKSAFLDGCKDFVQTVRDSHEDLLFYHRSINLLIQKHDLEKLNYDNAVLKQKNGMISTYELIQIGNGYASSKNAIIADKINYINLLDQFSLNTHHTTKLFGVNSTPLYQIKASLQTGKNDPQSICLALLEGFVCENPDIVV